MPLRIAGRKPRRIEHEQQVTHVLMDLAVHFHQSRLLERQHGTVLVLPEATQIESLSARVRKHVVELVVLVREDDPAAGLHRSHRWTELITPLADVYHLV